MLSVSYTSISRHNLFRPNAKSSKICKANLWNFSLFLGILVGGGALDDTKNIIESDDKCFIS